MSRPTIKHGKGPGHGKSMNKVRQATRKRSWERSRKRKDRRVFKSSHGAFASVADLERHRLRQ